MKCAVLPGSERSSHLDAPWRWPSPPVAYAYFSTTGSGTGTATVGSSSTVTLHATVTSSLYPGTSSPVSFTVDNPSSGAQRVGTITPVEHHRRRRPLDLQHGDHRRQPRLHDGRGHRQPRLRAGQRPDRDADRDADDERNRGQPGRLPGRDADPAPDQQLIRGGRRLVQWAAVKVARARDRCLRAARGGGDAPPPCRGARRRGRRLGPGLALRGWRETRRAGRARSTPTGTCQTTRSSSTRRRVDRSRPPSSASRNRAGGPAFSCRLDQGRLESLPVVGHLRRHSGRRPRFLVRAVGARRRRSAATRFSLEGRRTKAFTIEPQTRRPSGPLYPGAPPAVAAAHGHQSQPDPDPRHRACGSRRPAARPAVTRREPALEPASASDARAAQDPARASADLPGRRSWRPTIACATWR